MCGLNYYSLATLPALDQPGARPPLGLAAFLAQVPPGVPRALARAVLLGEDLQLREAVLAGERHGAVEPAVLTPAQLHGEDALPPELEPVENGSRHALPGDAVWEAYFCHAAEVARQSRSTFLQQWVASEVRLRNELARTRAQALGLQPRPYLVARALESSAAEVDAALEAWLEAPNPLAGLRALLAARWRWIEQQEPVFTFANDEYPAYAAKLALLHRWQRSAAEPPARPAPGGDSR